MLDQAETTDSSTEEIVNVSQINFEEKWEEVLKVAPAMGRLPDMLANEYDEISYPDPKELKELREHVADRLKTGIILIFEMIENSINKLFERFDLSLGSAIDIWMDDVEASYEESEGNVENYSIEEGCGRLLAYLAIDAYCRERRREVDDGTEIDEVTGWFKDLEVLPILLVLESALQCIKMTPEFRADVKAEAIKVIHFQIFLLLEPSKNTRWH